MAATLIMATEAGSTKFLSGKNHFPETFAQLAFPAILNSNETPHPGISGAGWVF